MAKLVLNTIALLGSARRNGNTGRFMDRIAAELEIEVVDLAAKRMSAYDYEHRNRDDDFEPLMKRVLGFDQIILASPVYWYSVSLPMKVLLDRIADLLEIPELLSDGRRLRGKTAYVVCTSIYEEAPKSFVAPLRDTLGYLGMHLGGIAHANCRDGYGSTAHDRAAKRFAQLVKENAKRIARASAQMGPPSSTARRG